MSDNVIKIANCSGYYGDKLSAAKEMVDGGPIDVSDWRLFSRTHHDNSF